MKVIRTDIEGCFLLKTELHTDERGTFMESFNQGDLEKILGHPISFVQDNLSVSHKNVLRGLHFQRGRFAQAKFVRAVRGRVRDVVVDLRENSPTFGRHLTVELSDENRLALFIPKGFAHGFLALENQTVFQYKCDAYYHPEAEGGIIYNDPELLIDWGVEDTQLMLSEKDLRLPRLKEIFP